ncbi:hypothetical protein Ga0061079_10987 [Apibacter mensalis]|uniref:Uncharacterized protein n=1 Tax=Apibacter mensalis TaxID=1586267 RepID=A0A0X3ARG0_9FLAO|nr:hypothetical protein [Apibacter mensalis]CVK16697.1 hypothetical protein Ga0061079_10987 [Apibacter mensalis]
MKEKYLLIILLMFTIYNAQETENKTYVDSSNTNNSYRKERLKNSIPSYNLSKIEKLIAKSMSMNSFEETKNTDNINFHLSEKDFNKLTIKEKFTYTMIYPEIIPSNVNTDSTIIHEENKIFGMLPSSNNYPKWSVRQKKFLNQYRKNIQEFIQESSSKNQYMGLNFKKALLEINAIESIPFLINFYNSTDKNDKDLLTVLMLLVKNGKYYPFIRSNVYRQLYNDNENIQEFYIDYSDKNEEYILKTAHNFYLQSPKIK